MRGWGSPPTPRCWHVGHAPGGIGVLITRDKQTAVTTTAVETGASLESDRREFTCPLYRTEVSSLTLLFSRLPLLSPRSLSLSFSFPPYLPRASDILPRRPAPLISALIRGGVHTSHNSLPRGRPQRASHHHLLPLSVSPRRGPESSRTPRDEEEQARASLGGEPGVRRPDSALGSACRLAQGNSAHPLRLWEGIMGL